MDLFSQIEFYLLDGIYLHLLKVRGRTFLVIR